MKFVLSFSCGKDSTLALHQMLAQGHEPLALLVTINKEMQRSWFHGVDPALLQGIAESLEIPLLLCETEGGEYHLAMEKCLREASRQGAEACVFGDIDIEEHRQWGCDRCAAAGLTPIYPLWRRKREEITRELLSLGYRCLIKTVDNSALPRSMLGKLLSDELIEEMKFHQIDVCGENGEYHTIVVDGPIFRHPIPYRCGTILDFGHISAIDVTLA